jgi:hypothetical protein
MNNVNPAWVYRAVKPKKPSNRLKLAIFSDQLAPHHYLRTSIAQVTNYRKVQADLFIIDIHFYCRIVPRNAECDNASENKHQIDFNVNPYFIVQTIRQIENYSGNFFFR